ncbi:MAG TPA: hypothetical protein VK000_13055, partial [Luteimonas sp.]|nr:hypothetical protein [Luteimonas sp.]
AVAAVAEVAGYDRRAVRAVFERRYSAEAMARSYEALYARLLPETAQPLPVLAPAAVAANQPMA